MTSPPDKLFRDHLEPHEQSAPAPAWDRIESGLRRRSAKRIGLRVAAVIILLLGALLVFWPNQEVQPTQVPHPVQEMATPFQQKEHTPEVPGIPKENNERNGSELSDPVRPVPNTTGKDLSTAISRQSPAPKQVSSTVSATPVDPIEVSEEAPAFLAETIIEVSPPIELIQSENTIIAEVQTPPAPHAGSTLVYSAREVHARFLKKIPEAEATPDTKNTSGLKKVIDLTAAIKYDEGAYGDLRDKKNDLLVLGFLNKKQETEK